MTRHLTGKEQISPNQKRYGFFVSLRSERWRNWALICFVLGVSTSCLKSSREAPLSEELADCTLNSSNSVTCKVTETPAYVTRTAGSDITSWSNPTGSTSVSAQIPTGFYSGKAVTFTSTGLLASNIRSGVSIFGVTGTNSSSASTVHRSKGSSQITIDEEALGYPRSRLSQISASGKTFALREVPDVVQDDEGGSGENVTYVNRSTWGTLECGSTGSVATRIASCSLLGADATWSGETKGNAGQGNWKLVSRSNCSTTCKEVWRDERTQLLWSSKVSTGTNWCRATGSNNIFGNSLGATDPSSICDNPAYQNASGGQSAISACYEDTGFTSTHASIDNTGKSGLGVPNLSWRVPTIYDWQVANVNGIRFVLPDMGGVGTSNTTSYEWSASIVSDQRSYAWTFDVFRGQTNTSRRDSATVGARCIGREVSY